MSSELEDFARVQVPVKAESQEKEKKEKTEDLNYEEFRASLQKGALFNIVWHRIILDEARMFL
jgi:hypothetical protein